MTNGGTIDARSTGHVAPGNSSGAMTVTGDVALNNGATYDAEINGDGTGDLIDATGKATFASGSTVHVIVKDNGEFIKGGDQWTIIKSDNGMTDDRADVLSNFAGFNFDGAVPGNNYLLTAVADALAPATGHAPRGKRETFSTPYPKRG